MSQQHEVLRFRREQLQRQINAALDLLQGSLHKNPSQRGYHLTTKVDQKTDAGISSRKMTKRV